MSLTAKARHRRRAAGTGGVAGNEHLTAMTGFVLLVLLAAEGVTILRAHQQLTVSLACGLLLAAATLHLTTRWGPGIGTGG